MRIVKIVAPIKINNHWVYRVDDTIEITHDELNTIFGYFMANEVISAAYVGCGNTLDFVTRKGITFAQYLEKLIEMKPTK
jgi:hypothetical protein